MQEVEFRRGLTTLRGNDTTFAEGAMEQFKVCLLEKGLSRTFRVAGVGDDDVKLALLVLEELEAVANDGGSLRVFEANGHAREVLLGETDDGLINVTKDCLLNTIVLDNFTEHTAVTTTDNQDLLRVRVGVHGKMGDHLLVAIPTSVHIPDAMQLYGDIRELVTLSALDDVVENEYHAIVG